MMGLLVFLTFLSLITNQYVPVWSSDTEAAHMNTAVGQFGGIKGAIDLQSLAAQSAGPDYVPVTAATAVTLGVDGIPVFGFPTTAVLTADPDASPFTVAFDYLIPTPTGGDLRSRVREQSNGSVVLDVRNTYSAREKVVYENGAVIRTQRDGQVVRAPPTFLVSVGNGTIQLRLDLVSLYGRGAVTGTGTEVVNTRLFATDLQAYDRFPTDAVFWMNHTSAYGRAWYQFLNATLADALKLGGTYTWTPLDQSFTARSGGVVVYKITVSYVSTTQQYITRLEIRSNPGIMGLGLVRLRHAQVQVGIGEAPEDALK